MLQVSCGHQAIATIVPGATQDEHSAEVGIGLLRSGPWPMAEDMEKKKGLAGWQVCLCGLGSRSSSSDYKSNRM